LLAPKIATRGRAARKKRNKRAAFGDERSAHVPDVDVLNGTTALWPLEARGFIASNAQRLALRPAQVAARPAMRWQRG